MGCSVPQASFPRENVEELKEIVEAGRVTLVYGAKDQRYNNAVALKEYLEGCQRFRKIPCTPLDGGSGGDGLLKTIQGSRS